MTPNWQPTHLADDVIKLTPLAPGDFKQLYAIASDPLIWQQHPQHDRYKREVFQQYFDSAIAGQTAFLIWDKATGKLIGCTRYYDYDAAKPGIAIGFTFLATSHWGGHYNRHCKSLLLDYAFRFVDHVYFHIGAQNIRSQKGTMKMGAQKLEETTADDNGQPLLQHTYVIEKKDWVSR